MSGSNNYWNLLHRRLTGALDEQGREQLDQWIGAEESNRRTSKAVGRTWELSASYKNSFEPDVDAAFAKFKKRIVEEEVVPAPKQEAKVVRGAFGSMLLRIAAVMVMAIGAAYLYTNYIGNTNNEWTMAMAPADSQREVKLDDGTIVYINGSSKLEFPQSFSGSERRVKLDGEAFFDVARDEQRPFIIETVKTQVTVLGTSFNVRAMAEEAFTEVVVKTGKVRFADKAGTAATLLTASQKAVFDHQTQQIQQQSSEQFNEMAWQTKSLSFRAMKMRTVIPTLEKYFKVKIEVSNPKLLECTFNNIYPGAELNTILTVITETFNWK
ncbi:MAG: FecR domain-containing protein, partial [Bacteroidota bacterium]